MQQQRQADVDKDVDEFSGADIIIAITFSNQGPQSLTKSKRLNLEFGF